MPDTLDREAFLADLKKRDLRRRFDDTYKTLLIIGPVLSFSLSNFSDSSIAKEFGHNIGFQYLVLAVLLWALPNLYAGKYQYLSKMAGFVLIVYVFLIIAFIVFNRGQFYSPAWYIFIVIISMLLTYYAGKLLAEDGVLIKRDIWIMVAFAFLVGILTVPLVFFSLDL